MERLRHVARADRSDQTDLVREAAAALAALAGDHAQLVTACQRLVDRHPGAGAVWNLCARLLAADEARSVAWEVAESLDLDRTGRRLAASLPDDAVVAVVAWPEAGLDGLVRRGDLRVVAVDMDGHGAALVRCLTQADVDARWVREAGMGQAVAGADLVLLEADVWAGSHLAAPAGALAAAAVARHAGVPVWAVAGAGRALHPSLWAAVAARLTPERPGDSDVDVVPGELLDTVVGPAGAGLPADRVADGPPSPELLAPPRGSGH